MAVLSPSIPSGPYTATWVIDGSARDIGLFEGPIRLQQNLIGQPVMAHQWGRTIIDYIMQGAGCFGVIVIKEWTSYTKKFIWPFGSTHGIVDEPGKLFSGYCAQLVLTAVSGTPAATLGPVTRTYPYVATLPGHNLDITLGPTERNVVVAVAVLPEPSAQGSYKAKFFTDT